MTLGWIGKVRLAGGGVAEDDVTAKGNMRFNGNIELSDETLFIG